MSEAMRSCADRQELFRPPWKRMIRYAVAKFISLGVLPENAEWDQWEPTLPPRLSVDAGRERAADQNDYRLGIRNLTDILEESGLDLETQLLARAIEVALRKKIAAEVSAAYGVEIYDTDMCLQTINGNPEQGGEEPPQEETPGESPGSGLPRVING